MSQFLSLLIASLMPISAVLFQLSNGFKQRKLMIKRDMHDFGQGDARSSYRNPFSQEEDGGHLRNNRQSIMSFLELQERGSGDEDEQTINGALNKTQVDQTSTFINKYTLGNNSML